MGGLGLYLARVSDVDVTGLTLSTEQQAYAQRRAFEIDAEDSVRFFLKDYRQEVGQYDRIVSVGMFEHVGVGHYREYFEKVRDLLNEDGVALIHTIGRADGPGAANAWINKYIFPGGYVPALSEVLPAVGEQRARVALLIGCAADAFYPQTTLATAKVLQHNGCEVLIPKDQACCGALHYHGGVVDVAQDYARTNCQAFLNPDKPVDAIITNAGGCGPVLKEYQHVLQGTDAADRGQQFSEKVKDVHEFLVELGPIAPTHPLPLRATYHDACGLCHAQGIRSQPRQLLEMIPELQLVPLTENDHCCGAAGSYNVEQPEMAEQLGKRKAEHVVATTAEAIFTGNVGCLLQIDRSLRDLGKQIWVAHPMEALWASYSGERAP